jgi:hypothetical protein
LKTILRNSLIISTVIFTSFLTYANFHHDTSALTNVNQTQVRSYKFITIFINLTKDGNVQQFASSQKTINGTDAQLRTAFAKLVKEQNYQNKNVVSTTFLRDDNKTQEVYGKGHATPAVFDKWFNTTLTAKPIGGKMIAAAAARPPVKVWITICTVEKCYTTHSSIQPQLQ